MRNWDKKDILKPHHVAHSGFRYYSQAQVDEFFNIPKIKDSDKLIIGYCRVSSNKQKDDLERQVKNMETYMLAKGYQFKIITDIGSGINYNKKGLNELLNLVLESKVDKIVVLYKDRLVRFGFELIENICKKFNTSIEIIDSTEKTQDQELVEDMIQIITVFSARLQGKRAQNTKKLLKELKADDYGNQGSS